MSTPPRGERGVCGQTDTISNESDKSGCRLRPRSLFGKSQVSPDCASFTEDQPPPLKKAKRKLEFPNPQDQNIESPVVNDKVAAEEQVVCGLSQSSASTCTHTQPLNYTPTYSQESIENEDDQSNETESAFLLSVTGSSELYIIRNDAEFCIGHQRDGNDLVVNDKRVSRRHCRLKVDPDDSSTVRLFATRRCFVHDGKKWIVIEEGESHMFVANINDDNSPHRFRLLPPGRNAPAQVFQIIQIQLPTVRKSDPPGSCSFDRQYKVLLSDIVTDGVLQKNKKGPNRTLPTGFLFRINLRDETDPMRNVLPLTTLRYLGGGRMAIVEAIWYCRGESSIKFLQENSCPFWDKQADKGGFIGLNYGLLTNFPQEDGMEPINQLEDVIQKLVTDPCSRNMQCTLFKPGEPTHQKACTSSIQFTVRKVGSRELLDLTVIQRSSDVVLGLPHDVVVWAIIYHLVRREVLMRPPHRKLESGCLTFFINPGGAHVYEQNLEAFQELRDREIKTGVSPDLQVDHNDPLMDIARKYCKQYQGGLRVRNYTAKQCHPRIGITQALEEY